MKVALYHYRSENLVQHADNDAVNEKEVHLVLCFGSKNILAGSRHLFRVLKEKFPAADIVSCSTAGEIFNTEVFDESVSVTAIQFKATRTQSRIVRIEDFENSYDAGVGLSQLFDKEALSYLMVLSDGSRVNGSELVRGLNAVSGQDYLITGGLAGDGDRFESTLVGLNTAPQEGAIVGVGFYGRNIRVSHGSQSGLEMFGLKKTVTRSKDNVLYEIDNTNALELYKKYLGKEAASLPGSALLFPLLVTPNNDDDEVIRTILSINEAAGSMTFAGDIPEGSVVRLMKANFDKLISAASKAAAQAVITEDRPPRLAMLVSCIGRKLILQSRTDEELEAIGDVFDNKTKLTGFYSYGEISPLLPGGCSHLHNQTITITTFDEIE